MSRDAEKRADEMINKLRKLKGLCPMSPEDADAAFDAAPSIPLTRNKIRSIINSVKTRELVTYKHVTNDSIFAWTHPSVKIFAPNSDPYRKMVGHARSVVLAAQDKGWTGPPFDPAALAKILKIPVEPCQDVRDARTVPLGKHNVKIEFNPNRTPARIRYSIAHELAHTFFPDCSASVRNRESRDDIAGDLWQLEMLCNVGAAELLLPIGSLEPREIAAGAITIDRLLKLSRRFEVSMEALLLRVVKLSTEPLMMFAASRIEAKNGGRYRIDYSQPSHGWPGRIKPGTLLAENTLISRCTKSGFTERGNEQWSGVQYPLHVESVAIPPYPGHAFPRVVGIASLVDSHSVSVLRLDELQGDALVPRSDAVTIIAHVVNDGTSNWGGGGFASAVRRRFPEVAKDFQKWTSRNRANLRLGKSRLCEAGPGIFVFSMVAQKGYGPSSKPRIRYEPLEQCLLDLAQEATARNAAVQMPKIGCGLAGGRWSVVRELIEEALLEVAISTTVYSPPGQPRVLQHELFE
jgi:O-acetyl-ADP-ribose deacetylase (regulator of RNase III)